MVANIPMKRNPTSMMGSHVKLFCLRVSRSVVNTDRSIITTRTISRRNFTYSGAFSSAMLGIYDWLTNDTAAITAAR